MNKEYEKECEHNWETYISSMSSNEYKEAVFCTICRVDGERDIKTQEVYWPAT